MTIRRNESFCMQSQSYLRKSKYQSAMSNCSKWTFDICHSFVRIIGAGTEDTSIIRVSSAYFTILYQRA
ncbi:hypothetical protein ACJIZ3_015469 [Penstemon smallii]|uniref:Uncharacterized protein n=1 Tax=Penstemon smallii TaxID=265156 RepID=A0ABD3RQX9_9LAMI